MPCTAARSRRTSRNACAHCLSACNLAMYFVRQFCAVSGLHLRGLVGHPQCCTRGRLCRGNAARAHEMQSGSNYSDGS